MKADVTRHFVDRRRWRAWLARNHASARVVWLLQYKVHTGKPTIPYEDAVEEALCFGWIDSIVRRIDDERYARKFTPRRVGSVWSDHNRRRAARMIEAGRMTAAGWAKIDWLDQPATDERRSRPAAKPPSGQAKVVRPGLVVPRYVRDALRANARAWRTFQALAPCYRRQAVGWVVSAKRAETRERRLREVVATLARGEKLGLK